METPCTDDIPGIAPALEHTSADADTLMQILR